MFVVGDVQACVERLVHEPPVGISRSGVGAVRVGHQAQAVVKERAAAGVVLTVLGEAAADVGEVGSDAVLALFAAIKSRYPCVLL
ncbi:MAG: hypothetical protein EAS51_09680 [Microbacteriaceae bacterium]|nr:MAG: hypothetical protein EAS51_09680 [Microbacteriaceae bacterium]